ncbi:F0F1 ATP synthase subunit B [Candidatus Saccharibacteria bacterium]|nr:F0F1 ATP synthase subunit B [Candidatus Saccharibacteria bacterium]
MLNIPTQFAEVSSSESGIGAFNINLKSFIFQLITFVIVLLVFKRWVLPPLIKTLEDRRQTLEKSLIQAKETEEALARAEAKAEEIITKARTQADNALRDAKKSAEGVIVDAETAAAQRAALIIKDAQAQLAQERAKLHEELKAELAELVANATEVVLRQKLDEKNDRKLIEQSLREIA